MQEDITNMDIIAAGTLHRKIFLFVGEPSTDVCVTLAGDSSVETEEEGIVADIMVDISLEVRI